MPLAWCFSGVDLIPEIRELDMAIALVHLEAGLAEVSLLGIIYLLLSPPAVPHGFVLQLVFLLALQCRSP